MDAPEIPGANEVVAWFGDWPSFHDAEVISINLHRSEPSRIAIHAWNMLSEVYDRGFFKTEKHAIVTFAIRDLSEADDGATKVLVHGFNHQNVLNELSLTARDGGYKLVLSGIHGVSAEFAVRDVSVTVEACSPAGIPLSSARASST